MYFLFRLVIYSQSSSKLLSLWESEPPLQTLGGRLGTRSCSPSTLALRQTSTSSSPWTGNFTGITEEQWGHVALFCTARYSPQTTWNCQGCVQCAEIGNLYEQHEEGMCECVVSKGIVSTPMMSHAMVALWNVKGVLIVGWDLRSKRAVLLEGNDTSESSPTYSQSILAPVQEASRL